MDSLGYELNTWRPRGVSKSVISRVIIRVTPFGVLITLLITRLLSPLGLQVGEKFKPLGIWSLAGSLHGRALMRPSTIRLLLGQAWRLLRGV